MGAALLKNRDEFAALMREHGAHVRGVLRRRGIRGADLDDLTQNVFIVAFENRDEMPRGRGKARAWLRDVSFRLAQNWRRLAWNRRAICVDPSEFDAMASGTGSTIETSAILSQWLDSLPPLRRDIAERRLQGYRLREIAEALNMSESSVFTEWKRAQSKFDREGER